MTGTPARGARLMLLIGAVVVTTMAGTATAGDRAAPGAAWTSEIRGATRPASTPAWGPDDPSGYAARSRRERAVR
jgi:hypothetical protein